MKTALKDEEIKRIIDFLYLVVLEDKERISRAYAVVDEKNLSFDFTCPVFNNDEFKITVPVVSVITRGWKIFESDKQDV